MKNDLKKILLALVFAVGIFGLITFLSHSFALTPTPKPTNPNCYLPTMPDYNSQACINERLGVDTSNFKEFLNKLSPTSIVITALRLVLGGAIAFASYKFVIVAICVAKAGKESGSEKKIECLKRMSWYGLALFLMISAGALTFFIADLAGFNVPNTYVECQELPTDVDPDIRRRCNELFQTKDTRLTIIRNTIDPTIYRFDEKYCILSDGSVVSVPLIDPCPAGTERFVY